MVQLAKYCGKQQPATSSDCYKPGLETSCRLKDLRQSFVLVGGVPENPLLEGVLRDSSGEHALPSQQLYQEVCCFMALAYSSADASRTTYVAREAFIVEVMKHELHTIEEAWSHAVKLEVLQPDSNFRYGII